MKHWLQTSDLWRCLQWARRLSGQQHLYRIIWKVRCLSENQERQRKVTRERGLAVSQSWQMHSLLKKSLQSYLTPVRSWELSQCNSCNARKLMNNFVISGISAPFAIWTHQRYSLMTQILQSTINLNTALCVCVCACVCREKNKPH